MKSLWLSLVILLTVSFAHAAAVPGKKAPEFSGKDMNGKQVKLADLSGQWVVLEWFNKDCPYVKKHYGSGNMQKLQKKYAGKGVKWLTVLSSAEGKQGYLKPEEAKQVMKAHSSAATAVLLEPEGKIGRAYGARTTPHMYVIDPKGMLVYAGAIDDNDSANPAVIADSKNYVVAALDAAMAGKKVETASTKAYGCGIKYK